ncbi:MAG: enoyl-CoA hydratase, partial [Betaproteobacteria bacterium RIFCSPLOWO2_12_FULL_67_28]
LYERDHAVVTLTLNRPRERNALSTQAQWDELVSCCERIRRDESIKVVILTGAGTAFSAGGNVKDMRDKRGIASGSPYAIAQSYQTGIQRIPLALHQLEVPTIAAVNGPAVGAGCDLACMCDIRIASENARFAESFVKLGIVPGDGGAWLLQRAVGYQRAAELSFTGDMIDAQTALAIGLVTRVVPHDLLMPNARELATRIAANSGPALRMAKRLLRQAQTARLDETLQLSAALQALAHHTPEHDQAVAAFFEQRK